MQSGDHVIVLEPTIDDMWTASFPGVIVQTSGNIVAVESNEGLIYLVPTNRIRKTNPLDYVTVGVA